LARMEKILTLPFGKNGKNINIAIWQEWKKY